VVVLGTNWLTSPWDDLDESERPERWIDNRIPLVVIPECPDKLDQRLGTWLKDHMPKRRNTVRFLLPYDGAPSAYHDRDLLVLSRAVCLAEAWKVGSPEYRKLQGKYESELRNVLKKRFDRFAILETWNFADTTQCKFHVVAHKAQGAAIPEAVDKHVREQLFIPEDFEEMVLAAAENTDSVAKLLAELQEPRPNSDDCVPWVGETLAKEKIERLCAKGKIAIDLRGSQYLQAQAGEDENTAWPKVRGRLGTGKHLEETKLLLPQAVPQTGGVKKPTAEETSDGDDTTVTGDGNGGTVVSGGDDDGDGYDTTTGEGGEPTDTGGGDIFGGGATKTYSAPATSSLNLMAKVESWGIGQFTQVKSVSLRVEGLTGAKLNELLKKLPDGVTYSLDVEKEEG
jgi:hypothetical protein